MKILHVIPQLASGGGERLTVDLCNQLAEMGYDVTLCVLYPLVGTNSFYVNQVAPRVNLISMNKKMGLDLKCIYKITRYIHKTKPDIVHTHLRALTYTAIAELFVVRGVHTVHSEASVEASEWLERVVRKRMFKSGRVKPVTISTESHQSFVDFYGFDAAQINNGRDIPRDLEVTISVKNELSSYRTNEKTRIIVHLAHLDDVKRQVLHARVAKRLYEEGYNFSILFIGANRVPDYTKKVKEIMPPCAHILGEKNNPLEYLKEAGAYALCSRYEGLPISLIEALGVGAVPICMPIGGVPNLVTDGINGILALDLEEESFYYALKRYLEMPQNELEKMKQKAFESYAPYSMTECAKRYVDVYIENAK